MNISQAVSEFFTGFRQVLRDVSFRLEIERRAALRAEVEELLAYGRARGLDAEGLADYAEAVGNKRVAQQLRRSAKAQKRRQKGKDQLLLRPGEVTPRLKELPPGKETQPRELQPAENDGAEQ